MGETAKPERDANSRRGHHKTLTRTQLPEPWRRQDNIYILRGYRPLSDSYTRCLLSLFHPFHNETLNIWTHLLGIPLFLCTGLYLWTSLSVRYHSPSHYDVLAFGCFFAGLVVCLASSTLFHTFSSHSKHAHDRFLLLDFLGILALIAGSWIPGIFYGFYCQPTASQLYWIMVSFPPQPSPPLPPFRTAKKKKKKEKPPMSVDVNKISTITSLCALLLTLPPCRTQAWKPFRTTMFLLLGASGVIPMSYAALRFGIPQANLQMGWCYIILEGIFYLVGATVYAARVPERWWPGRFDLVGASHQWFHVLVLCGAAAHLVGIVKAFEYNHHPLTRICEHFWS